MTQNLPDINAVPKLIFPYKAIDKRNHTLQVMHLAKELKINYEAIISNIWMCEGGKQSSCLQNNSEKKCDPCERFQSTFSKELFYPYNNQKVFKQNELISSHALSHDMHLIDLTVNLTHKELSIIKQAAISPVNLLFKRYAAITDEKIYIKLADVPDYISFLHNLLEIITDKYTEICTSYSQIIERILFSSLRLMKQAKESDSNCEIVFCIDLKVDKPTSLANDMSDYISVMQKSDISDYISSIQKDHSKPAHAQKSKIPSLTDILYSEMHKDSSESSIEYAPIVNEHNYLKNKDLPQDIIKPPSVVKKIKKNAKKILD